MSERATVVLVGAGVVAGAWTPVLIALRSVGFPDLVTAEGANFAMARLVYVGRIAERDHERTPIGRQREEVRATMGRVKSAIARELIAADTRGELSVRAEFADVMSRLAPEGDDLTLITTNWDATVERAIQQFRPDVHAFHLHGRADEPAGMYLPSEIVEEPYRERAEFTRLNNGRAQLVRAITAATRLAVYGLGLSALDAELGQVLASGIHGSTVREIVVIDPRYVDVAERLATLNDAGALTMPIRCSAPSELTREWMFSPDTAPEERKRTSAGFGAA